MANMVHALVEGVLVAVHTSESPSNAEWDAWMDSVRAMPVAQLRVIAITDGGGPNAVHRSTFVKHLRGINTRIAVLSDSLTVRGIATALSWFTNGIKLFRPDDFDAAVLHVGCSPSQTAAIRAQAAAVAATLSGGPPRAARFLGLPR